MDNKDLGYLKRLARKVRDDLGRRHLSPAFKIRRIGNPERTRTGGWYVLIGTLGRPSISVELWFDRFTNRPKRDIYCGFWTDNQSKFAEMVEQLRPVLGEHIEITARDCDYAASPIHLKRRFPVTAFGHPVSERYPQEPSHFYGIYEDGDGLRKAGFSRLPRHIADFCVTVVDALRTDPVQQAAGDYEAVENRKRVVRHMMRDRNRFLATKCKERDGYACRVCGFKFTDLYDRLGLDFAEAHHIVPLASDEARRSTSTDDLITVCGNCHRMLHRMSGAGHDVARLRRIVRKRDERTRPLSGLPLSQGQAKGSSR